MTTRREHHWLNRLRHVESLSTAADTRGIALRHHPNKAKRPTQPQCQSGFPAGSKRKLEFECDWQGRRIKKASHAAWNGSSYGTVVTTKFIYDGWNLLAELDASNNVIRSHVWGADLSGTMQGAAGVGGLLFMKDSDGTPHFAAHDGNGNVMGLVKGTDGTRTATYEYDPFCQPLRATGSSVLMMNDRAQQSVPTAVSSLTQGRVFMHLMAAAEQQIDGTLQLPPFRKQLAHGRIWILQCVAVYVQA